MLSGSELAATSAPYRSESLSPITLSIADLGFEAGEFGIQ